MQVCEHLGVRNRALKPGDLHLVQTDYGGGNITRRLEIFMRKEDKSLHGSIIRAGSCLGLYVLNTRCLVSCDEPWKARRESLCGQQELSDFDSGQRRCRMKKMRDKKLDKEALWPTERFSTFAKWSKEIWGDVTE